MADIAFNFIGNVFPFEIMQQRFMQQAMLALLIISPMTSILGVLVINSKMSFFSDAISHSVFAGVAFGLIFSFKPEITMPVFCVLVGVLIIFFSEKSALSSDTVIGVVFAAVVATGLAIVSRDRSAARNAQQFLYGDILSVSNTDILLLFIVFFIFIIIQYFSFNKFITISVDRDTASAHGIKTSIYRYMFGFILSLVVAFTVRASGVLLATAMLIVPAAAARNISKSAGANVLWSVLIGLMSSVVGLIISAQEWAGTASGATVVLTAFLFFLISLIYFKMKR